MLLNMRKLQVTSALWPVEIAENPRKWKKNLQFGIGHEPDRTSPGRMILFCRQRCYRKQHFFLAHHEIGGVERGQLEAVTMGLKTGMFAGGGKLTWNRFTGPGRLAIQTMFIAPLEGLDGTVGTAAAGGVAGALISGLVRG